MSTKNGLPPEEAKEVEPLFANVNVSIVPGKGLTEDRTQELARQIKSHGGTHVPPLRDTGRLPVDRITHVIAASSDFPDYYGACDAMVSVVKPEWVAASLAKKKLANIRPYSPDPRLFFAGVTVTCADIPSGDRDAIVGGVVAMGGQYSGNLSKLVTHVVALTDQHEKCREAVTKKLPCKTVLPHWFDDCLRLGKRIDDRPYRLPNPEITRISSTDPVQLPSAGHLKGASSPQPGPLPVPKREGVRSDLSVFKGRKVMLSNDLGLGSRVRGTIEDLIASGGGSVTGSIHKADIYVCQYREGDEYRAMSRAGKDVGNLTWLYYLIAHDSWTSPLRRLLHYPVARDGLPGFKEYRISLSNYGGEARLYLENLVVAAGGEYTKTLRQDNSHLITARPHSEKCQAALEWNIHMVNHLWLEESYAKWEEQSLANPRYSHFPPRTNLGEVVGQTQVNKAAMEALFYASEDGVSDEDREAPAATKQQEDQTTPSKVRLPVAKGAARPADTAAVTEGLSHTPLAIRNSHVGRIKQDETKRPTTPARANRDGQENQTPSTTGSRGAKDRAMAKLQDLAPDMALYEKEKRRVGGVVRGGRRNDEAMPANRKRSRSQQAENENEAEVEAGSNAGSESDAEVAAEVDERREVKRAKKTKPPPAKMRLLITGYKKWAGKPKQEEQDKRRLRDLGIVLAQEPSNGTHLAAPSIIRTQKFLTALAYAPVVVSTDFIRACLDQNRLLPAEQYLLRDPDAEQRLEVDLRQALVRAAANRRQLLKPVTIYCTPAILGAQDTYRVIVEANGGQCTPFKPRHGSTVVVPRLASLSAKNGAAGAGNRVRANAHSHRGTAKANQNNTKQNQTGGGNSKTHQPSTPSTKRRDDDDANSNPSPNKNDDDQQEGDDEGDEQEQEKEQEGEDDITTSVYLISGDSPEEEKLWPRFRHAVTEAGRHPRVVKTEWLLDVALSQEMRWREEYKWIG